MSHTVRIMLLEEVESTRKNGKKTEEVLQEINIDAESQRDGDEMIDDLCAYLTEEYGVEIEVDDDDE